MSPHGGAHGSGEDRTLEEMATASGDVPHLDETVGPHSAASDDVRLSANDVTTAGVIAARADIQERGRGLADESTPSRRSPPHHPSDDPGAAEAADERG